MQNLDPSYIRYIYDSIKRGEVSVDNEASIPDGLIGMFEDAFKLKDEARLIRDVVNLSLEQLIVTEDLSDGKKSFSTSEVGTWLSNEILK